MLCDNVECKSGYKRNANGNDYWRFDINGSSSGFVYSIL